MKEISIIKSTVLLLLLFILSCSKTDTETEIKECNPSDISANIQFRKVSERCKDIDLLWDISFGVTVEFEIDIKCVGDCTEELIFYHKRLFVKNKDGIFEPHSSSSTRAFYECNKIVFPGRTLNTEVGNPGPIDYSVGDTILFTFFDAGLCRTDDITDCNTNYSPLDLPDFSFEYILTPEDFDCE